MSSKKQPVIYAATAKYRGTPIPILNVKSKAAIRLWAQALRTMVDGQEQTIERVTRTIVIDADNAGDYPDAEVGDEAEIVVEEGANIVDVFFGHENGPLATRAARTIITLALKAEDLHACQDDDAYDDDDAAAVLVRMPDIPDFELYEINPRVVFMRALHLDDRDGSANTIDDIADLPAQDLVPAKMKGGTFQETVTDINDYIKDHARERQMLGHLWAANDKIRVFRQAIRRCIKEAHNADLVDVATYAELLRKVMARAKDLDQSGGSPAAAFATIAEDGTQVRWPRPHPSKVCATFVDNSPPDNGGANGGADGGATRAPNGGQSHGNRDYGDGVNDGNRGGYGNRDRGGHGNGNRGNHGNSYGGNGYARHDASRQGYGNDHRGGGNGYRGGGNGRGRYSFDDSDQHGYGDGYGNGHYRGNGNGRYDNYGNRGRGNGYRGGVRERAAGRGRGRGYGYRGPKLCHQCNSDQHLIRDCPQVPPAQRVHAAMMVANDDYILDFWRGDDEFNDGYDESYDVSGAANGCDDGAGNDSVAGRE